MLQGSAAGVFQSSLSFATGTGWVPFMGLLSATRHGQVVHLIHGSNYLLRGCWGGLERSNQLSNVCYWHVKVYICLYEIGTAP